MDSVYLSMALWELVVQLNRPAPASDQLQPLRWLTLTTKFKNSPVVLLFQLFRWPVGLSCSWQECFLSCLDFFSNYLLHLFLSRTQFLWEFCLWTSVCSPFVLLIMLGDIYFNNISFSALFLSAGMSYIQFIDMNSTRNLTVLGISFFFGFSSREILTENKKIYVTGYATFARAPHLARNLRVKEMRMRFVLVFRRC